MVERQQILHLWLATAALDAEVKAWAFYDGAVDRAAGQTDGPGPAGDAVRFDGPERPYDTGLQALRDGWMLLQSPGPIPVGDLNGELPCEYVFERRR